MIQTVICARDEYSKIYVYIVFLLVKISLTIFYLLKCRPIYHVDLYDNIIMLKWDGNPDDYYVLYKRSQ